MGRVTPFLLALVLILTGCWGQREYTATGWVFDGGAGLEGVQISSEQTFTFTQENGSWSLPGLRGEVILTPLLEGWAFDPPFHPVRRKDGEVIFTAHQHQYPLSLDTEGPGSVQVVPQMERYPHGSVVQLTPKPDVGGRFSHWLVDGVVQQTQVLSLTMVRPRVVVAVFETLTYPVSSLTGTVHLTHFTPTSATGVSPVPSQMGSVPQGDEDEEYIVVFAGEVSQHRREQVLGGLLVRGQRRGAALVRGSQGLINALARLPEIAYVEPNYPVRAAVIRPTDPEYSRQAWHYGQIRLPWAWQNSIGDPWLRIAVLDTGVRSHPDLEGRLDLVNAYNFIDNNRNVYDVNRHGTHVTGTIAANADGKGGVGVLWEGMILPLKVLGDDGNGSIWSVSQGLLYAAGLLEDLVNPSPAQIINLSLSTPHDSFLLAQTVRKVADQGVLMVAAAGNEGGPVEYPAAYPEVIAVGAVTLGSGGVPMRAKYSNYGSEIEVVAPGGDSSAGIWSTYYTGNRATYEALSGTSMATPHVTGVIGLMLASGVPASMVRSVLQETAMDLGEPGFDPQYGHGLINAYLAVNQVQGILIMVGEWEGENFRSVAQTRLPLTGGSFTIPEVPPGEYQVIALVDVQSTGRVDPGDFFASISVHLYEGQSHEVNLVLTQQ